MDKKNADNVSILSISQICHSTVSVGGRETPVSSTLHDRGEEGPSSIEKRLAWLRAENAAGADIYFRPYRHKAWPLIFLDDLPPIMAVKIATKYRAAVIWDASLWTE